MLAVKEKKTEDKFKTSLEYIGEYNGVISAAIFDREGLVINWYGREEFDSESFSALALMILQQINSGLERIDEKPSRMVSLRTEENWLIFKNVEHLILAVVSENKTDELLKVRIAQAEEMITSHMKVKYPLLER